jgi:hypothetical protein
MIVPLLMLDACASYHRWAYLPIYEIVKVLRSSYIVVDRR